MKELSNSQGDDSMAPYFPSALFGFKKSVVNAHLTKLNKQHEEALEMVQTELAEVKRKNMEMLAELGQIPTLEYSLREQAEEAAKRDANNAGIINELKQQLRETEAQFFAAKEEMDAQSRIVAEKTSALEAEREKVTNILVLAEEKAQNLMLEGREQLLRERKLQEEILGNQRNQFMKYFDNLRGFRLNVVSLFDEFNEKLEAEETMQYNLFAEVETVTPTKEENEKRIENYIDSRQIVENNNNEGES
jgi:hypothetical protein